MPTDDYDETAFLIGDILDDDQETAGTGLETDHKPARRALRRQARRRFERVAEQEALADIIKTPPAPGESIHVVSDARFDFWTWAPQMVRWIGRTEAFYCSTWTASRVNVVEFFELWDAGQIGVGHFLTGTYFKRRETAVYTLLLEGIRARGGRYRAFQNHAKVMLLDNAQAGAWITVEGSANLTSNPRTEQYVITNERRLWEFHRQWMEEAFSAPART